MNYSANDNLEVMKIAKNYNGFLVDNILKLVNKYSLKNILDFGCSDGFFIKEIGPIFLKTNNQAVDYISKLKDLQEKCSGELKEEIEQVIKNGKINEMKN